MAFLLNSQAQGVSGKMNNLPKHHGAGPQEARGPMQLHRLHRLKAGPACTTQQCIARRAHTYSEKVQVQYRLKRVLQSTNIFTREAKTNKATVFDDQVSTV